MAFTAKSLCLFAGLLGPMASASVTGRVALRESLVVLTDVEPETRALPDFPGLPRRGSAGFGVVPSRSLPGTRPTHSRGPSRRIPACGPSVATHTLACHGLGNGQILDEIPMPGAVSSTPLFHEGSWLVGTSEGFFVRFSRAVGGIETPSFRGPELLAFWGSESRRAMANARSAVSRSSTLPPDWKWAFTAGSEFTGHPVMGDNAVFVTAANQYLYALSWETGKALWTLRLAPDANLRISSYALEMSTNRKEVLVGTSEGMLLGLSPQNGQVLWRHRIASNVGERFAGVVARPLALERSVVVSSAEGSTLRLSLDRCQSAGAGGRCSNEDRAVEWSYATGSVATPAMVGGTSIAVGGSDGSLALLDAKTGALTWKLALFRSVPVVAVTALRAPEGEYILASSAEGGLSLVSIRGSVVDQLPARGEPVGEFFGGETPSEACLSYAFSGFRCFSVSP